MFVGEGIVSGHDIISSNSEVFSSEQKMKNYKYGLIDYSNISQLKVSNSEIKMIASQDKNASVFVPDAVVAIAVKGDHEFGLNRMWEFIVENTGVQWETMVFRYRVNAEIWIKNRIREKHNIDITME